MGINGKTDISIQTVLVKSIEDVVKHIVTFIFTYHKNARLKGYYFVGKNQVIKELDLQDNPTEFFCIRCEKHRVHKAIWQPVFRMLQNIYFKYRV